MTDSNREQRPLLCDDYSDEEFDVKNYNYQRRNRTVCNGRARNYAKGAAAVLTRWPDNCSTSVAYWWLGVTMIAVTIFVIYNSVLIFGMIPTSDIKHPKYRIFNNEVKPKTQLSIPDVYMHMIVNNSTDLHLNKYLSYVKVISKKYPSFKYNFFVVLNDTLKDFPDYSDAERNELALQSLFTNHKLNKKASRKYNISTEYISLTAYLNDSPIKKFWRHLPPHLIEFLVRSISIWEKGGIAFNPKILIPTLYDPHYIGKLHDVFNTFDTSIKFADRKAKEKSSPRQPNNIQDIINNLNKDNNNISNIDLSEAENNDAVFMSKTKTKLRLQRDSNNNFKLDHNANSNSNVKSKLHDREMNLIENINSLSNSTNSTQDNFENVLPLFLKYIFQNKSKNTSSDAMNIEMSKNNMSLINNLITLKQNQSLPVQNILKPPMDSDYNNTITISEIPDTQIHVDDYHPSKNKYGYTTELSMDLKGNIIASKTACHAFLGTMFSNVAQHTEKETLTDFIIAELSLFCNGMLTSCTGVNVILV